MDLENKPNMTRTRTGGGYLQGNETWTGGESVMEVDSNYHDGSGYVVYVDSDWCWYMDSERWRINGGGIWQG